MSSQISPVHFRRTSGLDSGRATNCSASKCPPEAASSGSHLNLKPIGRMLSCFSEKFGTPRQPALVPGAVGMIEIFPPYHQRQGWEKLSEFSHIWVVFWFHATCHQPWKPLVRPPRLGGNRKVGVFATRSAFRPNPIGISAVKLERIEFKHQRTCLLVSGIDMVDQTPVLDIKPYLPWADHVPEARGGYAHSRPQAALEVVFSQRAKHECIRLEHLYPGLLDLLGRIIELDPRPAYKRASCRRAGHRLRLYDLEIKWHVRGKKATVVRVTRKTGGEEAERAPENLQFKPGGDGES